jgi:predicted DNA binding CopG/RHH family protein
MSCMRSGSTHLSTWISTETKQRFRAIATKQGVSESALLKRLIEKLLSLASADEATVAPAPAELRDARLTIRLRADDRLLLRERAAARGMPAATYLSVLTRSHLRSLAPLPDQELVLLGRSVSELNSIGRNLNVIARSAQQGAFPGGVTREELRALLSACEALRDRVRALIRANTLSWEACHAPTPL